MKKWNKAVGTMLIAATIAMLLPLGSVQALKAEAVMQTEMEKRQKEEGGAESSSEELENAEPEEPRTETSTIEEPAEEELTTEEPAAEGLTTEEPETPTIEEPQTKELPTEISKAEEFLDVESEPEQEITEPESEPVIDQQAPVTQIAQGISAQIKNNTENAFIYENNQFIKKIVHTITLTRNDKILSLIEPSDSTASGYDSISYGIYRKTGEGEILLEEGLLEIPDKSEGYSTNRIEAAYTQTGDYCIRIRGIWQTKTEVEFACCDFTVEKEKQKLTLRKSTQTLSYGETVCMDQFVNMSKPYAHQIEYEIREESGEKNEILEIGKENGQIYIKAIGLNGTNIGRTTITIRAKENAMMEASEERTLKVVVNPIRLTLKAWTDASQVHMYDTLAIKIQIEGYREEDAKELLESEGLLFHFSVQSGTSSYETDSGELECEAGNPYIFNIPVNKEIFKEFTKDEEYTIAISIKGSGKVEYFPYKANTVIKNVTLLGRSAGIKLSAQQDGVFDYRTHFGGTPPLLFVAIEDTTASEGPCNPDINAQEEGTGQSIVAAEADKIEYQISAADSNVVTVEPSKRYTTKDEGIPLCINGVGTTTLTVTADGSSVYTIESSSITITVKNSPIYDEDFVINVTERDASKPRQFTGDEKQTGFEKWQTYLDEHNGWINGSVQIGLSDVGSGYYNLLNFTENKNQLKPSEQFCIDGDRKKTNYEFWVENSGTRASTQNFENREKGIRSFALGIDTTAPVIADFVPGDNFYAPASTDNVQYFSDKFVLTGAFADDISGVAAIEYTTDINAENGAKWMLAETKTDNGYFALTLDNGIYSAIAVRAVDAAGNISEPACLKNKNGAFIKVIVDNVQPEIEVSVETRTDADIWQEYSAEGENWTNREIRFRIFEKGKGPDASANGILSGLHRVEYTYQSIGEALREEPVRDEDWQELLINEQGAAELLLGDSCEYPVNKNGYYYFRGVSGSGVKSGTNVKKRILLWQKMADKEPVLESGADREKCHNEWYNKASGTPVIDFVYPEYDTGVTSGEYAAPVTVHYNLNVKNENNTVISLADNKTATIRADFSSDISQTEFPLIYDDIAQLKAELSDDGIYTLEYWTTDAAGNKSGTDTFVYKVDCHEPTALKIILNDEEQPVENENTLVYDKFYQDSVSGEASAEYGISGKDSIRLLKAKKTGEWKNAAPTEDAEKFEIAPDMRCLLYIEAIDGAGNAAQGWTRGIVVDNKAPTGNDGLQLIVEPKGANKHGFFNNDVQVKISIQDAPNDGNSAGLKLVTCSVGTDGGNTIPDKELFLSAEDSVSENLLSGTEGFSITETIDAKANEGNHAFITVNATDRSENISTDMQELKIDVTKPEIEITFDNENAVNGKYYNNDRKAKINIKELNFDASLVKIKATRNGEDFVPLISDWQSDKNNHYAYVDFCVDGDYTLTVECMDLADNEADKKSAEPFTIDKTMPKVEIALEGGGSQKDYFHEKQTVVITVTEHNFNADDFYINVHPAGKVGSWEHKNDIHVIKVEVLQEGEYDISCAYKDLAGNEISNEDKEKMPLEFIIDTTNPVIGISGVENHSANAGTVIPNILIQDRYIEPTDVTIMLTTGKGVMVNIRSDLAVTLTEGGLLYTLNGLDTKPDDIYYLTVTATDKAGNVSELTYRFSLNRRGSAYDLTDLARLKDNYYNSYKNTKDIKIVEMNVDKVEEFALYLSHNADIIYGKSGSRPLTPDEYESRNAVLYNVDVSGNEDTGYVYTYTVYRENFAREGTYRLGIYSKDRAGNEVNNLLRQNGEEIQFVIDNTVPRVVIDGVENDKIYDVASQEVRVFADDNFKLAGMELTLVNKDGEALESWSYFDLVEKEGDTALITIKEHNEEVSLLYRAVDAAGNEVRTLQGEKEAKADFLVTTDKLVQLVNKPAQTPGGRGIVAALIISLAGIVLILVTFVRLKKATPNE